MKEIKMGKTRLNQIVAVVNGKKTRTQKRIADIRQLTQKTELFGGLTRRYSPIDEDGETLPEERKNLQYSVDQALKDAQSALVELFDVVATQDNANCESKADVVVNDTVVLANVPVTYLLFLEKQLKDLHTFVDKLPVLDPSHEWHYDENRGCFSTRPFVSNRTKKIDKPIELAPATKEHPAQVQLVSEDVKVGEWETTLFSTAIPQEKRRTLQERVVSLLDAVKSAREEANEMEVENKQYGDSIFNYLFK